MQNVQNFKPMTREKVKVDTYKLNPADHVNNKLPNLSDEASVKKADSHYSIVSTNITKP